MLSLKITADGTPATVASIIDRLNTVLTSLGLSTYTNVDGTELHATGAPTPDVLSAAALPEPLLDAVLRETDLSVRLRCSLASTALSSKHLDGHIDGLIAALVMFKARMRAKETAR